MRGPALRAPLCLSLALVLGATITLVALPSPAQAEEDCGAQACVEGASWASGEQLDERARKREAKRNRKRKDTRLSVELGSTDGRGSVFIDGVWAGTAPARNLPIKPGKHDVEIRDGQAVLARGVLNIPKQAASVTIRVR